MEGYYSGRGMRIWKGNVPNPTSQSGRGRLFAAFSVIFLLGSLLLVNGDGTVTFGNSRVIDSNAYAVGYVDSADLDGDGDLDIVVTSYWGSFVRWYENEDGKGTFWEADTISTDTYGAQGLDVGDLDGDGFLDIVVARKLNNQITWFRNLDGEAFSVGGNIDATGPVDVVVADADGDGDLDIIFTSRDSDQVGWYGNADGGGSFDVGQDISTTSYGARKVAMADLTGDGTLDIVSASVSDRVQLFKNSDGVFSLGVDLEEQTPAVGAMDIVTADVNGDGNIDVVSASFDGFEAEPVVPDGRLILFINDGAGSFETGTDIGLLDSARSVVAGDIDSDGDVDLVACDFVGGRIVWYENDGEGDFSAAIDIAEDVGVMRVIAADLDGDGDLDLVSVNKDRARVVWYENLLVEATPAPALVVTATPSAADTSAPTPSSMKLPANPTQTPASSIDRSAPSSAPAAAPTGGAEQPTTAGGGSDDGLSLTEEILIGVAVTLASGLITAVVKKMFF